MSKNKVEVVIGGKIYSLQGEESIEHMQKVASVINQKMEEIQEVSARQATSEKKHFLMTLNIADECVNLQEELERYKKELGKCSAENMQLRDRIKELTLELAATKEEITSQHKKNERVNRGR